MTSLNNLLTLFSLSLLTQLTHQTMDAHDLYQDKRLEKHMKQNVDFGWSDVKQTLKNKRKYIQALRRNFITYKAARYQQFDLSEFMNWFQFPVTIYFGPRDTMSYYSYQQASRLEYYTDFPPSFFNSEDEELYKSYMPKG